MYEWQKNKYNLSLLTNDDFTEEFKDIAEIIVIEAAYKLCELYGGLSIYIPKAYSLTTRIRHKNIQDDYKNGLFFIDLAKKYNISSNHIIVICSQSRINIK